MSYGPSLGAPIANPSTPNSSGAKCALLPRAIQALIAALFARLFDRLEQLLRLWQSGTLPPPAAPRKQKSAAGQKPPAAIPSHRAARSKPARHRPLPHRPTRVRPTHVRTAAPPPPFPPSAARPRPAHDPPAKNRGLCSRQPTHKMFRYRNYIESPGKAPGAKNGVEPLSSWHGMAKAGMAWFPAGARRAAAGPPGINPRSSLPPPGGR